MIAGAFPWAVGLWGRPLDWPCEWFDQYAREAMPVSRILRGAMTERELAEEELDAALQAANDG